MSTDVERVQRWVRDERLVTDDVHAGRAIGYVVGPWAFNSGVQVSSNEPGHPTRWLPLWRTREIGLKPSVDPA